MRYDFARHVFGIVGIVFGLAAIISHDLNTWEQIKAFGNPPYREGLVYFIAAVQLAGGIAIQWKRGVRLGAVLLGAVYAFFALLWIPEIVRAPAVYGDWGSFFEQFAIFSGAWLLYAGLTPNAQAKRMIMAGRIFFGLCVVSFTLEQALYLADTATFVPKWIPFGQMFWAVATTVALALAAIAILSGFKAVAAARLTALMIVIFGLAIWVPALASNWLSDFTWAANAENFGIAASAWILAESLSVQRRRASAA